MLLQIVTLEAGGLNVNADGNVPYGHAIFVPSYNKTHPSEIIPASQLWQNGGFGALLSPETARLADTPATTVYHWTKGGS